VRRLVVQRGLKKIKTEIRRVAEIEGFHIRFGFRPIKIW
jgi:hypothetical protein